MKGFKYQVTVTVLLYQHKTNDGDIEYSLVCFNPPTKTVISSDTMAINIFFGVILDNQI